MIWQVSEVTFVDCEAWGKTAEIMAKYLTKGKPVLIEGRLKYDQWDDKDGNKRSALRVVIESFQFVGAPGGAPGGGGGGGGGGGQGYGGGGGGGGGGGNWSRGNNASNQGAISEPEISTSVSRPPNARVAAATTASTSSARLTSAVAHCTMSGVAAAARNAWPAASRSSASNMARGSVSCAARTQHRVREGGFSNPKEETLN